MLLLCYCHVVIRLLSRYYYLILYFSKYFTLCFSLCFSFSYFHIFIFLYFSALTSSGFGGPACGNVTYIYSEGANSKPGLQVRRDVFLFTSAHGISPLFSPTFFSFPPIFLICPFYFYCYCCPVCIVRLMSTG